MTSATAAPFICCIADHIGDVTKMVGALRSASNGVALVQGLYAVPTGETGIAETGRAGLGNFGGSMLVLCVIVAYLLKMPFWWAVLLLCCGFWEDNIILVFANREK